MTYKTIRVRCKCGMEFEGSYLPGHRRRALADTARAVMAHKEKCLKGVSWLKTETHSDASPVR